MSSAAQPRRDRPGNRKGDRRGDAFASRRQRWWAVAREFAVAFAAAAGVRSRPRTSAKPPLEQICRDLHRINREIVKVLSDPQMPARYHRLVAATWAYDAALVDACRAVGVEPPERAPLGDMGRLETEAALTAHGVTW